MAAYLDDLAVTSDTAAEHLINLRKVLERTWAAHLRVKLAKCAFGKRSVELLGHRVSFGEVCSSDDHSDVFKKFCEPTYAAELLLFMGFATTFSERVEGCADRLEPLYAIVKGTGWNRKKPRRKNVSIPIWDEQWGEEQRWAFEVLKEIFASPKFLAALRPGAEKKLVTDASMYGLGAVLL